MSSRIHQDDSGAGSEGGPSEAIDWNRHIVRFGIFPDTVKGNQSLLQDTTSNSRSQPQEVEVGSPGPEPREWQNWKGW